jgi:hypothetical protein
MGLPES